MGNDRFVYVTYIRTTAEKLWDALTKPEFTRLYWAGVTAESTWAPGASWRLIIPDGRVADTGEIVESDQPSKLVVTWRNEFRPDLHAEGHSRCTFELEPAKGAVKLTIVHEIDKPRSKLIEAVASGWPAILSSLKSLLETGESLEMTREWPKDL
ncbi:MAG TPA: SRPBCC family protein [Roseiarcus sp.]|nr:SRPBCC family protein [Roseiarcus sp.]